MFSFTNICNLSNIYGILNAGSSVAFWEVMLWMLFVALLLTIIVILRSQIDDAFIC